MKGLLTPSSHALYTEYDGEWVRVVPPSGGSPGALLRVQNLTATAPPNTGWAWTISRKGQPSEVSWEHISTLQEAIKQVEAFYCGARLRCPS